MARWEYRPAGIRYSRREEMVSGFAERMAARVSDEDQQTSPTPADPHPGGAGENRSEENALPDHMALREPAARPSDGAGSENK